MTKIAQQERHKLNKIESYGKTETLNTLSIMHRQFPRNIDQTQAHEVSEW
jgi:hypothetical protein